MKMHNMPKGPTKKVSGSTSKQVCSRMRRSDNSSLHKAVTATAIAIVCVNTYLFYSRVELVGSRASQEDRLSTDSDGIGSNKNDLHHDPSPRTARDRDVGFLRFAWDYPEDNNDLDNLVEANHGDAYSGSWWQSTAKFLNLGRFEDVGLSQEGAS